MSTTNPVQTPPAASSRPEPLITPASRQALISNLSLGALIVCPIIIALPPRKLDAYTVALLVGTGVGANQVSRDYTGQSILERFGTRIQRMTNPLPPKAMEMQARIKAEKEARAAREQGRLALIERNEDAQRSRALIEAAKTNGQEDSTAENKGVLEKVWYGSEGKDWKAKRDQREKEALDEGRGYGGLIMDQIWEVWNWGQTKAEEMKEIDEKVVADQKAGKNENR